MMKMFDNKINLTNPVAKHQGLQHKEGATELWPKLIFYPNVWPKFVFGSNHIWPISN